MIKLPPSIPIFGKDYPLVTSTSDDKDEVAFIENGVITLVNPKLETDYDLKHAILHEMGHAMCRRTGIHQGVHEDLEEVIVENLATMVMEVFDISFKKELLNKKKRITDT